MSSTAPDWMFNPPDLVFTDKDFMASITRSSPTVKVVSSPLDEAIYVPATMDVEAPLFIVTSPLLDVKDTSFPAVIERLAPAVTSKSVLAFIFVEEPFDVI